MSLPRISIVGTVGVPGNYGGFETLAENLVRFHSEQSRSVELSVYCSSKSLDKLPRQFAQTELRYIRLDANGLQSIPYDVLSLIDSVRQRTDVVLLLGVSGALSLPFIRAFSNCKIITNIDGIEWKRAKWNWVARLILRLSESAARSMVSCCRR